MSNAFQFDPETGQLITSADPTGVGQWMNNLNLTPQPGSPNMVPPGIPLKPTIPPTMLSPDLQPAMNLPIPGDTSNPTNFLDLSVPEKAPGILDKVKDKGKAALKAAGSLTPEQLKALGLLETSKTASVGGASPGRPTAPGSMGQLGMAAPVQRKSLADILHYRG